MIFGSICSGIESASVALEPLGWHPAFLAEIAPHPCFVLAHRLGASRPRYMPDPAEPGIKPKDKRDRINAIKRVAQLPEDGSVVNFGDFTQIKEGEHDPIDVLIGGTPCHDFSIAGPRTGLAGDRGNLSLEFGRLAARAHARWVVWENVPGVLSNNSGRDFAAILGLLSGQRIEPPAEGWRTSGVVAGYKNAYGLAWRVLDVEFCRVDGFPRALPQRRERVFVVGYLGDWRRAAAVLLERAGMLGDAPPRREKKQDVTGDAGRSAAQRGFDQKPDEVAYTLLSDGGGDSGMVQTRTYIPEIMAQAITSKIAKGSSGPSGDEHHHLIAFSANDYGNGAAMNVSPTLRSMGAVNGNQNAGQIMAIAIQERATCENPDAGPDGIGASDEGAVYTLEARTVPQAVAFKPSYFTRDARHGGAPSDVMPALSAEADRGDQEALVVAPFNITPSNSNKDYNARPAGHAQALTTSPGAPSARGGDIVLENSARRWRVRRLLPVECERLQGFPDDWTLVPYGKKPMADGPRYKMIGASKGVNVVRWIGQRIEMVDKLKA